MALSMNWVKDYIDLNNENLFDLAVKVTNQGINVEHVISNKIDNLVVGKVLECNDHPDSDHLHVCKVDTGDEIVQIVCGAPNVRKDLTVIVAKVGAKLPEIEIKKTKIRGIESCGMMCGLYEIGLEENNKENYDKGLAELPNDAKAGMDALEYLGVLDVLYDLDVHKHKNNDCTNHIGFAYEIGSIIDKKVKLPEDNYKEINDDIKDLFNIKVETEKCPYYTAKMVTDLTIKESPEFIKKRLYSVGMRPINNVVDISNYVMLEYGQPLHFFDYDKLGNKIIVREAEEKEKITTLDNKERILSKEDIVITDSNKPVAIAGIMGGLNTDVDNNTKTVVIESAIFNSKNIRNTSRNINLRSEASIRYEKGLNFEYTDAALKRACFLLEKYADGKVLKGTLKEDKIDKKVKKVGFTTKEINSLLGLSLKDEDIEKQLEKLGFDYKLKEKFEVIIPNRRLDIEPNMADIAEEIGRLYGYDNIEATLPCFTTPGEYKGDTKLRKIISKRLRTLNLNEVRTYTLISPEMDKMFNYENYDRIKLPNPMSIDKSIIRTSVMPSLINTINYNKSRNIKDVNIYEISKIYFNEFEEQTKVSIAISGTYMSNKFQNINVKSDFYVLKGILENLFNYLGFKNRFNFRKANAEGLHPGMCAEILLDNKPIGIMGHIHPSISKDDIYLAEFNMNKLDIKTKPLKFKEISKFPKIEKDVAFVVDKKINSNEIEMQIKKAGGRLLSDIKVFDVYTGENVKENEKSIAYTLTFEDKTRTLTEEEVINIFNNIIQKVEENMEAKLRN